MFCYGVKTALRDKLAPPSWTSIASSKALKNVLLFLRIHRITWKWTRNVSEQKKTYILEVAAFYVDPSTSFSTRDKCVYMNEWMNREECQCFRNIRYLSISDVIKILKKLNWMYDFASTILKKKNYFICRIILLSDLEIQFQ